MPRYQYHHGKASEAQLDSTNSGCSRCAEALLNYFRVEQIADPRVESEFLVFAHRPGVTGAQARPGVTAEVEKYLGERDRVKEREDMLAGRIKVEIQIHAVIEFLVGFE